jgi:hypothetical protein
VVAIGIDPYFVEKKCTRAKAFKIHLFIKKLEISAVPMWTHQTHVVAVAAIATTEWLIKSVVRVLQSGKEKSVVIVHCATHIYCVCLWARSLAIHLV